MHENENHKPSTRRETMLTIMLTLLGGGGFLLFLIFVSGGFFFYVMLAVAAITVTGYFHYLVWGYSMSIDVEEEKAHLAAQEREQRHEGVRHRRF